MIGNDIIDLSAAKLESNWQRRGFLEKQFTKNEQRQILSAQNSFADAFTIDCSSVKSIFKLLNSIFNPLVGLTHAHRQYLPGFDLFHHQLLSKSYLDKPVARTRFE